MSSSPNRSVVSQSNSSSHSPSQRPHRSSLLRLHRPTGRSLEPLAPAQTARSEGASPSLNKHAVLGGLANRSNPQPLPPRKHPKEKERSTKDVYHTPNAGTGDGSNQRPDMYTKSNSPRANRRKLGEASTKRASDRPTKEMALSTDTYNDEQASSSRRRRRRSSKGQAEQPRTDHVLSKASHDIGDADLPVAQEEEDTLVSSSRMLTIVSSQSDGSGMDNRELMETSRSILVLADQVDNMTLNERDRQRRNHEEIMATRQKKREQLMTVTISRHTKGSGVLENKIEGEKERQRKVMMEKLKQRNERRKSVSSKPLD